MFPAGAVGIALLVLRLSAAAALLAYGARNLGFLRSACALFAIALCLGLLTPYVCCIACLIELAAVIRIDDQPGAPIIFSILNTAALAALGPGAYSLDARIFGRRIVSLPNHHKPGSS